MDLYNDKRTVLTLDAGGTNFVFSAVQGGRAVTETLVLPSNADNLDRCLQTMIDGFSQIAERLDSAPEGSAAAGAGAPVAISFAFPGPADYAAGIIGDLGNLPAFRGGVALGPMLQERFDMPVFINNDGDLFAYGEAIGGLLPYVNELLGKAGSAKQYRNLAGVTLGTGFGGGLVRGGELILGDNGAAGEVWVLRSMHNSGCFVEEDISIRAIVREYKARAGVDVPGDITPKDIFEIATQAKPGDAAAAKASFERFGQALGDAMANLITLLDGLVVVGGGLSRAWPLFAPSMMAQINGTLSTVSGDTVPRTEVQGFNLEDEQELARFLSGEQTTIGVPFSNRTVSYDPLKRAGVGISRLGTSEAVSVGAYAFALNAIDS